MMSFKRPLWLTAALLAGALAATALTTLPRGGESSSPAPPAGGQKTGSPAAAGVAAERTSGVSQLGEQQFRRELARLDQLLRAKDLEGFVRAADEIEQTWGPGGGDFYGRLMLNVSSLIVNGFDDEKVYALSQRYAAAALTRADSFSLELETKILPFLAMPLARGGTGGAAGSEWAKERRAKVGLWLRAWQRLERETDKNFNAEDRPSLKVTPPEETGLPAGVAPEAIKDPTLRTQYEAALSANAEKARYYDRQFVLRFIAESFPKAAESFIVNAYSKPPFAPEELEQLLDTYVPGHAARKRILDSVSKSMTTPPAVP